MHEIREIRMPAGGGLVLVARVRGGGVEILHGEATSAAVLWQARLKASKMLKETAQGGQAEGAKDEKQCTTRV